MLERIFSRPSACSASNSHLLANGAEHIARGQKLQYPKRIRKVCVSGWIVSGKWGEPGINSLRCVYRNMDKPFGGWGASDWSGEVGSSTNGRLLKRNKHPPDGGEASPSKARSLYTGRRPLVGSCLSSTIGECLGALGLECHQRTPFPRPHPSRDRAHAETPRTGSLCHRPGTPGAGFYLFRGSRMISPRVRVRHVEAPFLSGRTKPIRAMVAYYVRGKSNEALRKIRQYVD
jgi:hypothetical protein